jgi:hypothetical protein
MGRGFEQHGEFHVVPAARRRKEEKKELRERILPAKILKALPMVA